MFVLNYPFTSQIFCINNDIMQNLLITKKIEMTFYSIMESISHLGKMARTSAKSENPIRRFHVVVVQWTLEICTNKRDARAELLFFS